MSTSALERCEKCGRSTDRLFPRERVGQVCATCYETVGRQRPEWSRLEIAGVAGLMVGSALLVIAIIALLLR